MPFARSRNLVLIYPHKNEFASVADLGDISLALLYLAGAARNFCDSIVIFDCNLPGNDDNKLQLLLADQKPLVVGINCLFSGSFPEVRRLARLLKNAGGGGFKIVIGGIHPTMFAAEIMAHCPEFDATLLGEADTAFPKLLAYYAGDNDNLGNLDSVVLRVGDDIVTREKAAYIENLDALPQPGYEYLDWSAYATDEQRANRTLSIPLLTSRSCPNQCNFCAMRLVMGNRWRAHSAEQAYAEIKFLHEQYGVNLFKIMDDNFTFDKERVLTLCGLITRAQLPVQFITSGGLMMRTLDEEVLAAMAGAGFRWVRLAIESGSEFIRNKIMRKNISNERIYEIDALCEKYQMVVDYFFIIGMPEETETTLRETYEMGEKLAGVNLHLSRIIPFPHTKLFAQCVKDNLFVDEFNFAADRLWNAENYANINTRSQQFYIKPYNLSLEKLAQFDAELLALIKKKKAQWMRKNALQKMKAKSPPRQIIS